MSTASETTTPFDVMRASLSPRGRAPIVNLTAHLGNSYFDEGMIKAAIDAAEQRVLHLARYGEMAEPISPLEAFAINFLMRASGQAGFGAAARAEQEQSTAARATV